MKQYWVPLYIIFSLLLAFLLFASCTSSNYVSISKKVTTEDTLWLCIDRDNVYITSQEPNDYDVQLGLINVIDTFFVPKIDVKYKGDKYRIYVIPNFDEIKVE